MSMMSVTHWNAITSYTATLYACAYHLSVWCPLLLHCHVHVTCPHCAEMASSAQATSPSEGIVANCPGMAGTLPEFGPMSQLCPRLPDLVAMSQNTARLHKWGCGSSINLVYQTSFGPYISIFSGRGGWNLGAGTKIVGVATQKWAWSKIFVRTVRMLILCPRLSSCKLGNYVKGTAG